MGGYGEGFAFVADQLAGYAGSGLHSDGLVAGFEEDGCPVGYVLALGEGPAHDLVVVELGEGVGERHYFCVLVDLPLPSRGDHALPPAQAVDQRHAAEEVGRQGFGAVGGEGPVDAPALDAGVELVEGGSGVLRWEVIEALGDADERDEEVAQRHARRLPARDLDEGVALLPADLGDFASGGDGDYGAATLDALAEGA